MKSILMSLSPHECYEMIHNQKQAILRKNHPITNDTIKCYIYCTNGRENNVLIRDTNNALALIKNDQIIDTHRIMNQSVIGEFTCTKTEFFADHNKNIPDNIRNELDFDKKFLGAKFQYAWFITNMVIYENPKELSYFRCDSTNAIFTRPPLTWNYCRKSSETN